MLQLQSSLSFQLDSDLIVLETSKTVVIMINAMVVFRIKTLQRFLSAQAQSARPSNSWRPGEAVSVFGERVFGKGRAATLEIFGQENTAVLDRPLVNGLLAQH